MARGIRMIGTVTLLLSIHSLAWGAESKTGTPTPFPVARVHVEQNATDKDLEVLFEVIGGDEGLSKLLVTAPDGRAVVDFKTPDSSPALGIRQFQFESPEPRDIASLKAAYPEGVYTFTGITAAGRQLRGRATLGHKLPTPTAFVQPKGGARGVTPRDLAITWAPVKNLVAYMIEIEQEQSNVNITTRLPASTSSFAVPNGFLLPGKPYRLAIGTVATDGNVSYIETTFTTAAK